MKKMNHPLRTRLTALFLTLVCVFGLIPTTAFAASDTIKLKNFGYTGVSYQSAALGRAQLHQMYFQNGTATTVGFCGTKGGGMGDSLRGQTWGNKQEITDPTVITMMAYFYSHANNEFSDEAIAMGENNIWSEAYCWRMNAWVQAVIWRYKQGLLSDPVVACAEELMAVYNSIEGTSYTSIDEKRDGSTNTFRDISQYVLELGERGVWGKCQAYEYSFTGSGSGTHPASSVQKIILGDHSIENKPKEDYFLIVKKVDSSNPTKGLAGAKFHIQSQNGSYSEDVVTGADGTCKITNLSANTYAITETEGPAGYEIDNAGPQYVTLPNNGNNTVTVTFSDTRKPGTPETPDTPAEGSIRKVDADDPTKGLAGAVIKITGVDNSFVGTYTTGGGGYLTDVPWESMPTGSYLAEEVTPPEGYSLSPDSSKVKQTFVWDGKTDVSLVFENDAKVKIKLMKLDDSNNPLPGAVFNILKDGQIIGTEATKTDGSITVTDVTEGMYAFVEVSAPSPYAKLTEPVIAHVDQTTINGGGTVTVSAADKKLPNLTILKRDAKTGDVIPGAHFEIKGIHLGYHNDVTTGPDGKATLTAIPSDSYEVTEKSVPDPWVVGDEPTQTIWLEAGDSKELIFDNLKQPLLKISKVEKGTNKKIPGTVFLLEAIDGDYRHEVTTEANGSAELRVAPGSYKITEQSVPEPYYISDEPTQTISLNGGDEKEIIFQNLKKPELTLSKIDADTKEPIPGTVLRVEAINGDYQDDWTTGPDGKVTKYVVPGTYRVTEISVPSPWYLPDKDADRVQTISLNAGDVKELVFRNRKEPQITIFKEDSVAGAPIEGAKFHVTYTSNGEASDAPASADYGYLFTDANGEIKLHEQGKKLYPGEFTITEVAPAPGFQMKEPTTQTVIIHGNESKTVTFQNEPLNAIIVEKYDSVTHEALPGCTFQLRYLGGTSGTGGTVIGQKVTGKNGTCIWTGLKSGTYVIEEVDPADGYSIINSSETVYLADSGEQSVITIRFDNAPDGNLLIRKVCSVNPSITLQDAEFKVTYADGTLIGDSNGIYRTDAHGEIRIEGLKPGKSVIVTETKAPDGFIIDTQSQTIQIKEGRTVSLTFKNQPRGKLIIQKRDSISGQPLPGAQFRVTTAAGCEVGLDGVIGTATLTQNGIFTTDSNGEIRISNLAPGALILTEIKAPAGYVIDTPSTNVMIGPNGDTQTVIVTNTPKGGLIVEKYDKITKQPLAGAQFKIVYSNGELLPDNEGLTSSNGLYTTDQNGQIVLSKVQPGTLIVTEDKAPDFYQKDPTPQTVVVNAGDTQTLRFYDDPLCTLTILKRDAVTHKPLSGGQFLVQYSDGHVIGPNNGLYTTGSDGTVTVSGLRPNATVMVSEQKAPTGYILDQTPKNIVVRSGVANGLIFDNQPGTTLIIQKFIEGTENKPLSGVAFKVTDGSGAAVGPDDGTYYTDKAGEIVLSGIEPGTTVKAREIKTVDGFVLDGTPQDILIKGGEVQRLTFWNKRAGTLLIEKLDSVTKAPLAGAQFKVLYADGRVVDTEGGKLSSNGIYFTDSNGQIKITQVTGTLVVTEEKAPDGYVIGSNDKSQTVVVNPQDTQTLRFYNDPMCSLTLTKLDSVTGKPVPNTEFVVKDGDGNVLGRYVTGKDGTVVVTGLIPGSTVVVSESRVPDGYVLDTTPKTIIVKNGSGNSWTSGGTSSGGSSSGGNSSGGGNDLTFENDPKMTLTIHKYIEGTANEPLAGVAFKVVDGSGKPLNPDGGVYYTNNAGEIVLEGLEPGTTITAQEIKTVDGYVLDGRPQSIKIEAGKAQNLTFWNAKAGSLVIRKLDKITGEPLAGVEFEVIYAEGGYVDTDNGHLSSKGLYTTDDHGEIHITGIVGTVVIKETRPLPNYTIEPGRESQTITVNPQETQTATFYNIPANTLTIEKYLETETGNEPLKGVTFLVTDSSGAFVGNSNGEYTTDENGCVVIPGLTPGITVTAKEIKVPEGVVLDSAPKSILIKEGEAQVLRFTNKMAGTLVIQKLDKLTGKPLAGVEFELTYAEGGFVDNANGHLSSNGRYTTNDAGEIRISGVTGTIVAKEVKCLPGYTIDPATQTQTVKVNPADTQTLKFYNVPGTTLTIQKLVTGTKDQPLAGVEFLITDSSGAYIGPNQGIYRTDEYGRITLSGLKPGTVITAKETKTVDGFVLDGTPKSIEIKEGEAQTLTFYNAPIGGLELIKVSASDETRRIPGVTFEIRGMDGALIETVTTGENGRVHVNLDAGDYYAVELKAAEGYKIDATPHYFTIRDNETTTLTVTNAPFSGIIIHKINSVTGDGIYDVKFLLYDENKNPIGQYSTDNEGYIYIDDLTVQGKGRLYLRELEAAPGYELDKEYKTIYVQPGKTIEIEWENTPITGQIQVMKYAAEYNEVTGTPAGTPLQGAVYEISDPRSNKVVDYITTDARGIAASKPLPLGRYKIVEVTAPAYWQLSKTVFDETLEYSGQIIKVSDYDKPAGLGVTITKRGNAEVLAGNQMRYDFTIANTSNVPLENFYWHDRIPTDAARAMVISTGTYSARLNYRILYKTNYTSTYQVLASNLITTSTYSFSLSAIPMQAGEYVTDVYFDFGKVPVGFQSTSSPTLTVAVSGTAANGYQLVNRADAGGKYQGTWQTAQGTWVTVIRKLTPTVTPKLPKTGY
ncbi:SpaA isopeptide-forming pilin-related protein [uncultured Oscillibacter sp.]|uniref:SpaA isopeptide-forming pilin-related protein n=1 Tax=uncultured Oscillibacter sp. TaxID=876091 RepID=UPI00261DD110|nr:SpaA isopeptide-forming pilin-related protein [uncultured Oscillibacter sp.]